MRIKFRVIVYGIIFLAVSSLLICQPSDEAMTFIVSMDKPSTHYYHVEFRCEGLKGKSQDFKIPAWTPGYYRIMDYAKNVLNFHAADEEGNPLAWEKVTKNTWRVESGSANTISVSYDVYAFNISVAESFLDDRRAFISPTSVFMHIAGKIGHPVTLTIKPSREFSRISTGLDPVEEHPNTFYAPDFDILYDCPILIGNQEILNFDVQGIPHVIAIESLRSFDKNKFLTDIKLLAEESIKLIGEIPYKHYTFIMMEEGRGGLEHLNSMAVFYNLPRLNDPSGYKDWLCFIAHEFFHLYNVKRIRPVALGPFDYDKENYTHMLWVSEGITVYYEYLILRRAGLLSQGEFFGRIQRTITNYESRPGRLFQSAAESSFDTWMKFFDRNENSANTTISYYDKGAALGLLLDLKIRHGSKNKKSLDFVMRVLYEKYHKAEKRGFTDDEFRKECEDAAGCPLSEVFDVYVSTVKEINYPKYFAYAGLDIDVTPKEQPGVFFGAETRERDGHLMITSVEWDSPAQHGGLSARDEILSIDGIRVTSQTMNRILSLKKPGDKIRILLSRRNSICEAEVMLGSKTTQSFRIKTSSNLTLLQQEILEDWLRASAD